MKKKIRMICPNCKFEIEEIRSEKYPDEVIEFCHCGMRLR